jgi:hypothetical protein
MAGAPQGNRNAHRGRKWREAISRALARKAGSVDQGLDSAADKLVTLAIDDGDKWALEEIGDRIDGKPAQAIVGGDDDDNPIKVIQRIERAIVRTNNPDTDG